MANSKYTRRLMSRFLQVFLTTFALLMMVIGIGTVIYVVATEKQINTPIETTDFSDTDYSGLDGENEDGESVFGDKKITTFAVFGVDEEAYRTDVNLLVFFNHENYQIDVVSIPRDTQVKIPDEIYETIKARRSDVDQIVKINEVPAYVVESQRSETSVAVIEKSLGVDIDYYVKINLDVFKEVVNMIGEITIEVPAGGMNYEDPVQNLYIHLDEGLQTLNGDQAEQFVRFRSGYSNGDLGRVEMQQVFMKAFIKQLLTTKNRLNMVNIMGAILLKVDTNFETAVDYLIYLDKIQPDNFAMHTLPGEAKTTTRSFYIYDYDATKLMLDEILNRAYQTVDEESQTVTDESVIEVEPEVIVDIKSLKMVVMNGTRISGFAGKVTTKLEDEGFIMAEAADYDTKPVERTFIRVPHEDVFNALKTYFVNPKMELAPELEQADIQVEIILGQDDGEKMNEEN